MKLALDSFYEAFPDHIVSMTPRPDGTVLVSLAKNDENVFSKAIGSEALFCKEKALKVIHQLQRDIKLEEGGVFWKGSNEQWVKSDLPTYLGQPIHLRALQTLVSRRRIK